MPIVAFPSPRPACEHQPVDLEAVRAYVNALPVAQLGGVAARCWRRARTRTCQDVERNLYIVACIACRIADEGLWQEALQVVPA